MSQNRNPDVIIVGAGPAGLACAKILAEAGLETIVLERSKKAGIKNFYSGLVYSEPLQDIFGRFWDGKDPAPFERYLSEHRAYLLQKDTFVSINLHGRENNPNNKTNQHGFNILRKPFLNWMAQKVQNAGASINYEQSVSELIIDNKKVCGVKTNNNTYFCNVVVLAEGVNSLLVKKSGLRRGEAVNEEIFLFVEETIALSSELIQQRLSLKEKHGIAAKLFTHSMFGIQSVGYLNTNKDSISLGIGVLLSESISSGININNCMEELKSHPAIKPIIKDGITNNYVSFMLPSLVGGISLPKICVNGCLIIGGALLLINPYRWDISSKAILSAKYAADSIIKAKALNDFTEKGLCYYKDLINENILRNINNDMPVPDSKEFDSKTLDKVSSFLMQGR